MATQFRQLFFLFLMLFCQLKATPVDVVSYESDPDAFICNNVNVINGDYFEASTDLAIPGPDLLTLQRFYSAQSSEWKILPQNFLVIGKDVSEKTCEVMGEQFEFSFAFVGERSGSFLPYRGWRKTSGITKGPLEIDALNTTLGLVNTYSGDMNGQTNHLNNLLYCKRDTCELFLGDGSKRIYKKAKNLSSSFIGNSLDDLIIDRLASPDYFLLIQEILPSGNQIVFSYDPDGNLISMEMKNASLTKTFSWMHFTYHFQDKEYQIVVNTSDERSLTYDFHFQDNRYVLSKVEGSHCVPFSYQYNEGKLVNRQLPEGRFCEVEYEDGKVKSIKRPNAQSGKAEIAYSFVYEDFCTTAFNALGVKTKYFFNNLSQLVSIERYDNFGNLYRKELKFWGKTRSRFGFLIATAITDGFEKVHSYRSFVYDMSGNVTKELLYGNLSGTKDISLKITSEGIVINPVLAECRVKTFKFSKNGFNLLTKVGDSKGNKTIYVYKRGTNLLEKKLIFSKGEIKKRHFLFYNEDGVCIKAIEDDGCEESEGEIYSFGVTERHIKEIKPKQHLPGVGYPEIIEEKGLDLKNKKEVLIRKTINTYDERANLLSSSVYDPHGYLTFREEKSYNSLGQVSTQTDALGKETYMAYDRIGNKTSIATPQENKITNITYDFLNLPIETTSVSADGQFTEKNCYDVLGRKVFSIDRFGNQTCYEYDAFDRIIKISHPMVANENNTLSNPVFKYSHDLFGNVVTIEDPKGDITRSCYNLYGDVVKTNYPDGSFEVFNYDVEGCLFSSLSRDRIQTIFDYDYQGRTVSEEYYVQDQTGANFFLTSKLLRYNGFRCTYEKNGDLVKRYKHDEVGRLAALVVHSNSKNENDSESRITQFCYDALGRISKKKVFFDEGPQDYSIESFSYDMLGNVTEKKVEDAAGNILLHREFLYDNRGLCSEEYIYNGDVKTVVARTLYNSEGEPVSCFDALEQETKISIDNFYKNHLMQNVVKKTIQNSQGISTDIEYDTLGRIYCISKKDSSENLLSLQKFFYDLLGNKVVEINEQIVDGEILNSQRNIWDYGPMGRLDGEVIGVDSESEKRISYSYDSCGRMISKHCLGADSINYIYDRKGNIKNIEVLNHEQKKTLSNNYLYDRKGNIISTEAHQGISVKRDYNVFGEVVWEMVFDIEGVYTSKYSYDRKGRVKEIILPDNSKISYCYDALFGQNVSRISPEGKVLYTHNYGKYDKQGKLLSECYIGRLGSCEHSYDLNGKKTKSVSSFFDEEYSWDSLGRLQTINGGDQKNFSYNGLSQLISEHKNGSSKKYAYDSLDNRLKVNDDEICYNAANQLIKTSKGQFFYDPSGNLLRKVLEGEETDFKNNAFSQLILLENPDKTSVKFSYDGFGRLLSEKHIDSQSKIISTSRYFYLDHQEIGSLDSRGKIEALKILGLDREEISQKSVAFEINGKDYVPFHDITGNVVALIDPYSCELVESYSYSAFGEEAIYNACGGREDRSLIGNPWRFSEKRVDEKTGYILFGIRFYDPANSRWICQDPLGFIDGPNLYAYLRNNPLNNFDRFGLTTESRSKPPIEYYDYGGFGWRNRKCCTTGGGTVRETKSSTLPKIRYCDNFERSYPRYEPSCNYDLSDEGLQELPDGMEIGFVNGIWNTSAMAKESARYVSKLAGGHNIHAVYNATHGMMTDIVECCMGLNYRATEPVRQIHKMWNSFFEKHSSAKHLTICHSQGVIHTRNALLDYPPQLRNRIIVLAVAPAAYVYERSCAKVIHYRANPLRDFVPRLDIRGSRRSRNSIRNLNSHPFSKMLDHEFTSPTYEKSIRLHISNYIKSRGDDL